MTERIPLVWASGMGQGYHGVGRYTPPEYRKMYGDHSIGDFGRLMLEFSSVGFEPRFFQPNWQQPKPQEWAAGMAAHAIRSVEGRPDKRVVLGGFSCGALVATLATKILQEQSTEAQPIGLVTASMSPFFGRDWVAYAHTEETGLRKVSEVLKANFSKLQLPMITCPAQLYVGALELPTVQAMRSTALSQWPLAEAITPPCWHDVFDDSYLQALGQNIGKLLPTVESPT